MSPPAGLLLVASLHSEPVGCGALIFYPDDVGLVKRMWVAAPCEGWASAAGCSTNWRPAAAYTVCA